MADYRESKQLNRYAARYAASFPPNTNYALDPNGSIFEGTSSRDFRNSRGQLMNSLLNGERKHRLMTQSLLAEDVVNLALQPVLQDTFNVSLAPQTVEWGLNGKGVDIIIADPDDYVYLGIDVKLRPGMSPRERDGHGWSEKLKAPYIYLCLGNWSVGIKEREEVRVLDWIDRYTVPNLKEAKPIPAVGDFRRYVLGRIERNLYGYKEHLLEPDYYTYTNNIPASVASVELLEEKLAVMHGLFTDIRMAM